jgi:hypothetical protein
MAAPGVGPDRREFDHALPRSDEEFTSRTIDADSQTAQQAIGYRWAVQHDQRR